MRYRGVSAPRAPTPRSAILYGMEILARRSATLVCLAALGAVSVAGCSLVSMVPGVPHMTTSGAVVVTYDGKVVKNSITKLVCMFDGKGNVAFLSGDENSGDTFVGGYTTDNQHVNTLKTAEYPLSLMALNNSSSNDISKASVDGGVYTFEGVMLDMAQVASGSDTKKPYKAVVTCK